MRKPIQVRRLEDIRQIVHSGEHGHGTHAHHEHGAPFFTHKQEGINPYLSEYNKPWSVQTATHIPENEGKRTLPMYLPMSANDTQGDGKPVNSIHLKTRMDIMNDVLDEDYKNGSVGAIYRSYFMAWLSFAIMLFALTINVYLAGVFAYLVGYYWSEKELSQTWSVEWWKGKTLISTV
ncbi:MAG: hypothetical protein AABY04_03135 [Candidatus Micrarchaeota archaeon]